MIGFFCGNLNIVEKMEDKTSCGHILSNKENFAWQKQKDVLKEPITWIKIFLG
jgi:hypothetical protein